MSNVKGKPLFILFKIDLSNLRNEKTAKVCICLYFFINRTEHHTEHHTDHTHIHTDRTLTLIAPTDEPTTVLWIAAVGDVGHGEDDDDHLGGDDDERSVMVVVVAEAKGEAVVVAGEAVVAAEAKGEAMQ